MVESRVQQGNLKKKQSLYKLFKYISVTLSVRGSVYPGMILIQFPTVYHVHTQFCNKSCFYVTLLSHILVIVQRLHAKFNTKMRKPCIHVYK
jgi:hypothetical protein